VFAGEILVLLGAGAEACHHLGGSRWGERWDQGTGWEANRRVQKNPTPFVDL